MPHCTLGLGLMLLFAATAGAQVQPFVFAQLTDTHVADSASSQDLAAVLSDLRRHEDLPEFVLVTGDLSDFGETATLNRYTEIMEKSGFVHYSVLGNHDSRWSGLGPDAQEAILGQSQPFSFFFKGVHFIGLNSALPLEAWGHIDPSQSLWLEQEIKRYPSDVPRILFCHHPFLYPDRSYQPENERLMRTIESAPVVLFLGGHGHSFKQWTVNSVRHQMGGATVRTRSYQLVHVDGKSIRIDHWVVGEAVPRQSRQIDLWPQNITSFAIDSVAANDSAGRLDFFLTLAHEAVYDSVTWWLRRNRKTTVPLQIDAQASAGLDTLDRWLPGFNTAVIYAEWPDGSRVQRQFDFTLSSQNIQPLWTVDLQERIQASIVLSDQLIVAGKSGRVWALRPQDGSVLWSQTLPGEIRKGLTCSQDRCFVATSSGLVACLNRHDGRILWRKRVNGAVNAPPAYVPDFLYVATGEGTIFELDGSSGEEVWAFQTGDHIQAMPFVNDTALFVGSWDRNFYAVDTPSASLIWNRTVHDSKYFAPATAPPIAFGDHLVFIGAAPSEGEPSVYACNPATGEINWTFPLSAHYCPPQLQEDRLLLGAVSGIFYALDREGRLLWQVDTGEPLFDAAPVVLDDEVLLSTLYGTVWRIDAPTGEIRQRWQMGSGFVFASPAGDEAVFYCADLDGRVMALRYKE